MYKISINAIKVLTNQLKYKPDLVEPKCKKRLGKHVVYNLLEYCWKKH